MKKITFNIKSVEDIIKDNISYDESSITKFLQDDKQKDKAYINNEVDKAIKLLLKRLSKKHNCKLSVSL